MRILVVGPGGVGGYLAAKFYECNKDITVLARDENSLNNGLKVIDVDKEIVAYPKTLLKGVYDVVFVTTKYYDLDSAIEKIKPYINSQTRVVPILNGLAHFEKFKDLDAKILKACIYILSNKEGGVIRKKTPLFYLCVENDDKIKQAFSGCELKIKYSDEIEKDIWKKYLFISTFATIQSFYQKPTGWVLENRLDEVEKFIDEVIRIAKIEGIDLSGEKEKVLKQAKNIPYESKMSMQIDFENANKTEVESITGYLAKKSEFIDKFYKELNAKDNR